MLDRLSPARRRFLLGLAAVVVTAAVAIVAATLVSRPEPVDPVAQGDRGPVVLVPGYGGSTAALDVLADALRADDRDVIVFDPPGDGTGDLRDQATALRHVVDHVGASSVDVVGYSAGGVVARIWASDLGGDAVARRVVTLSSPNHGTDLATVAGGLGTTACPAACQELATGSDLLRELNAGDETPDGPRWVAIRTDDDKTVVPPDSGVLDGATTFSVQDVCPGLEVSHADMPRTPAVIAMVMSELGRAEPRVPSAAVCQGSG